MVLLAEPIHPDAVEFLAREAEVVGALGLSPEAFERELADADAIIVRLAPVSAELFQRARKLTVVAKHGVGIDNIDVSAATEAGIPVVFAPDTSTEAVAEFAVMQMLRLARNVHSPEEELRAGHFSEARRRARGSELRGKVLGVIGLGRIGLRVAEICAGGFEMRVLAHDPYLAPRAATGRPIEVLEELDTLLRAADFVSIHVPLSDETRGLIGTRELGFLKRRTYLINCSRGGVVDEEALAAALRRGAVAGAAVDVFAEEPPGVGHPLLDLDNVLLTPHIAGSTEESLRATAMSVAEEVLRALRGERPLNIANEEVWPS